MKYFITGHTGFKGAWLSLWLTQQGHSVSGLSLDPEPGSLFDVADVHEVIDLDIRADIRDYSNIHDAVTAASPDVVIHMAAQPLVRESYRNPRLTMETNVMGTLNLLESVSSIDSVKANLIITTDKVYRNVNQVAGYKEDDPLGGDDPYSASKAMADILTQSWSKSFGGPPTAIARAGNVIGGGDISRDRLLPDVVRALTTGDSVTLRYPHAVRPWQHVFDCLNGYLAILDHLLATNTPEDQDEAWNIGPDDNSFRTVSEISKLVASNWGETLLYEIDEEEQPHEAGLLALNPTKAHAVLGWRNQLSCEDAVRLTCEWHLAVHQGKSAADVSMEQIQTFTALTATRQTPCDA
jgi:CDP-glucose 4,6-dehydratase